LPYETRSKTGRTSAKVRATKLRWNFSHERTQSTPLDPKLTFWCVSYCLGTFVTVWLPYETRCKTGRSSAKVHATKSHRNFSQERTQSTPLDPKLTFWCVSYNLGAFGTVWLPYETRCKTGRTRAKVRATKSRRNFSQERTQSTPLDPKLTFWFISYYLGAFGTFACLTKVHAMESRRNVSHERTQSTPLDPKLTFWCVLYYLSAFGTVWCLTKLGGKRAELPQKFVPRSRVGIFLQRTHPIRPIGPQPDVLVRFVLFGCIRDRLVALQNSEQNGPK
jgi:hypothetical protein